MNFPQPYVIRLCKICTYICIKFITWIQKHQVLWSGEICIKPQVSIVYTVWVLSVFICFSSTLSSHWHPLHQKNANEDFKFFITPQDLWIEKIAFGMYGSAWAEHEEIKTSQNDRLEELNQPKLRHDLRKINYK